MSVVYIAGKMAGLPDMGKQHFHAAAARLREEGHIVLNPAELPDGMPVDRYMPLCLAMIGAADTVYALDNWSCSMGAIIEVNYARYQGKTIINEAVCKANEPVNETCRLDGQVKKPYTPAEIRVIHAGEMTDRDKAFRSSILGRMEDDQEITKTEKALRLVAKERNRQIAMWGDGNENHPFEWMSIWVRSSESCARRQMRLAFSTHSTRSSADRKRS